MSSLLKAWGLPLHKRSSIGDLTLISSGIGDEGFGVTVLETVLLGLGRGITEVAGEFRGVSSFLLKGFGT